MNFTEKIKNQIRELFEDTALTVDQDIISRSLRT